MIFKRKVIASAIVCASLLAHGCASFPETKERPDLDTTAEGVVDGWNITPAVTRRPNKNSLDVASPDLIPDSIRSKPVSIKTPGFISQHDLVFIFDQLGVQTIVSNKKFEGLPLYLPSYDGDVGGLTDLVSETTNLSFRWSGGALIIDTGRQYTVRISQQKDLADLIAQSISDLGGRDVFVSKESGTVTYVSSSSKQKNIARYLDRLSVNTALIQIQLAVLNVRLIDERRTGFDWSNFKLNLGDASMLADGFGPVGDLGTVTGSSFGVNLGRDNMSLAAALNLLSSYGESRTSQNLTLQTLSGVPVSLKSGDRIPYVSDIPTTVNENSTTSGLTTDIVETGFEVNVEALFDADESIVTVSMDLVLKSLTGFRELSAGNQLGSVTQPEIQEQELSSIIKLGAGETALLGGLIIETFSDNRRSLAMLENMPLGSQSLDNNQNAIFIMLRPTVTVFGGEE